AELRSRRLKIGSAFKASVYVACPIFRCGKSAVLRQKDDVGQRVFENQSFSVTALADVIAVDVVVGDLDFRRHFLLQERLSLQPGFNKVLVFGITDAVALERSDELVASEAAIAGDSSNLAFHLFDRRDKAVLLNFGIDH